MKPASIRKKGQEFERVLARDVLHALRGMTPPPTKKEIYRTPLSGGHPFAERGDLVIAERIQQAFPFCVEAKHQKIWTPGDFISSAFLRKNELAWISQLLRATPEGVLPILVMQGNRTSIHCALPDPGFRLIFSAAGRAQALPYVIFRANGLVWRMILWEHFLKLLEEEWPQISKTAIMEPDHPRRIKKKKGSA